MYHSLPNTQACLFAFVQGNGSFPQYQNTLVEVRGDRLSDRSSILLTSTSRGVPLHPIRFTLCRAVFYCRPSILSKTQPLFRRGGHFPSRFFVNTQSHRCDNLCVTFTNSGACPCTQSALLYVRRFFIAAHGSLFINPTLLFHHGRR